MNSHESNDINIHNNKNKEKEKENNFYPNNKINSANNRQKNSDKVPIPKSVSMKYINNNQNNMHNHFLSDNKRTTKIILIKNLNNIENNNNIQNNLKLQNNNFGLFKKAKMHRGLSDYNLKIDTNNLDLISIQEKFGKIMIKK